MTGKMKIQIAIATDQNMLNAALVVLGSALENASRQVHLHFLGYEIDSSGQDRVRNICVQHGAELTWHNLTPQLFAGASQKSSKITLVTLARMYLPQWVQGKILYLDCDMLVCDDIATLFDTDLGEALLGVTRDPLMMSRVAKGMQKGDQYLDHCQTILGETPFTQYFNAGLLLMDCDRISKHSEIVQDMADVSKADAFSLLDQDHLNTIFKEKTCFLPVRWNDAWGERRRLLNHTEELSFLEAQELEGVETPAIYHFTGAWKPWHRMNVDMLMRGRFGVIRKYKRTAKRILH